MALSICSSSVATSVAGLILATGAFAQQDECLNADPIAFDTPTAFDTTTATASAPYFSCGAGGGDLTSRDVWFTFTSNTDYAALVTTCGTAAYDTKMEVYSGACDALVSIACNDDSDFCTGYTTTLEFDATSGTQYWLRIGGWRVDDFGAGDVLVVGPVLPYECADAYGIGMGYTDFDTTNSTMSAIDFSCMEDGGDARSRDVWFKYTATEDFRATISTCGIASYDTKIEVYQGTCGALVSVACDDDTGGCSGYTTEVRWDAILGTQYFLRVGGWREGSFGGGQVRLSGLDVPSTGLPNDESTNPIELKSGVNRFFDNELATFSTGEGPFSCGDDGTLAARDIWYSFTTIEDGPVEVATCSAQFEPRFEVYSGDSGNLVSEGCKHILNAGCFADEHTLRFHATAGTTYKLRLAGNFHGVVSGFVSVKYPGSLGNDDCSGAYPIGPGVTPFTNVGAFTDSPVPMPCGLYSERSDVWFSYTASANCSVSIDLSGSDFDTDIQVHSGDCWLMTAIGCEGGSGTIFDATIDFDATASMTYLIQVGGFNVATGTGVLKLTEGIGTVICPGEANSTGVGASLALCGSTTATDNDLTLMAADLPMNVNLLFVNSRELNFVANPGGSEGNLCIASFNMGRHTGAIMSSGTTGTTSLRLNLGNLPTNAGLTAAMSGDSWYWQGWYRDTVGGVATSNYTAATCVTFE